MSQSRSTRPRLPWAKACAVVGAIAALSTLARPWLPPGFLAEKGPGIAVVLAAIVFVVFHLGRVDQWKRTEGRAPPGPPRRMPRWLARRLA